MRATVLALAAATLLLGGCGNGQQQAQNDDLKKSLDQLVQTAKEMSPQVKEIANGSKATDDALKTLTNRIDEMHKDMALLLSKQKRGAVAVQLESETVCDNDAQCANTARAVCNRINYPNGITNRFTPGIRPSLNSLICFD